MDRFTVSRTNKRPIANVRAHFSCTAIPGKPGKYDTICNYCDERRRACGTDQKKAHLSGSDSKKAKGCTKVPADVRDMFRDVSGRGSSATARGQMSIVTAFDPSVTEGALKALATWAVACGVLFHAIDNDLFKET